MTKVSMNTRQDELNLESSLSGIPRKFRDRILASYLEIKKRFTSSSYRQEWDAVGLSVGKFCESVIRFIDEETTGSHVPFGKHIPNFPDACRKIIAAKNPAVAESIRVILPRSLVFLYTLRGKRGIGHVGGDVDANLMDINSMTTVCDWIICELIRVYHKLSLEEAQVIVDAVTSREFPDIWQVAGRKRVLRDGMSFKDMTLLLLYSDPETAVYFEDMVDWLDHKKASYFKRDVVKKLHASRLIEYDSESDTLILSPKGVKYVEENVI